MSLNKTKIEWTDFTWNPVTGCWGPGGTRKKPQRCWYCYANRQAPRNQHQRIWTLHFAKKKVTLGNVDDPFAPTIHPRRFKEDSPRDRKKSSKIFVCSVSDLLGDWIPEKWIEEVLEMIEACPQHTFQILTKNPKRYPEFKWPKNCWLGATATDKEEWDEAVKVFGDLELELAGNRNLHFISCEPLLDPITPIRYAAIDWLIIGGLSGHKTTEEEDITRMDDAEFLMEWAKGAGIPIFLKDNLNYPKKLRNYPTKRNYIEEA